MHQWVVRHHSHSDFSIPSRSHHASQGIHEWVDVFWLWCWIAFPAMLCLRQPNHLWLRPFLRTSLILQECLCQNLVHLWRLLQRSPLVSASVLVAAHKSTVSTQGCVISRWKHQPQCSWAVHNRVFVWVPGLCRVDVRSVRQRCRPYSGTLSLGSSQLQTTAVNTSLLFVRSQICSAVPAEAKTLN